MKKYIMPIMAAMLMASCASEPTSEEKAQKLIKDYIMTNANNPKSYESISFGALDSTFSSYYASERYKALDKKRELNSAAFDKFMELRNLDSAEIYMNDNQRIAELMTSEAASYKGEHFGWKMTHRYRAANGFGAITLGTTTFFFNKELTEITRTKNEE